jgi:methylmalonyl-CoA mutase N-terminal domain/subunit
LGGSYFIESLTDTIEREAQVLMDAIERRGGMVRAIEQRFPQSEIERAAYEYQRAIETGERVIVGVNQFADPDGEASTVATMKVDPSIEAGRVMAVQGLRAGRDGLKVQSFLDELKNAAADSQSGLMDGIVKAARAGATVGEMSDVLRGVFGEYHDS